MTDITPDFNNAAPARPEPSFDEQWKFSVAAWEGNIAAMQEYLAKYGREAVDVPRGGGEGEYNAFMWAAKAGNVASLEYLLSQGSNINYRDKSQDTPLLVAAWMGNGPAAQFLLEHGADYDVRDKDGLSPAARARESGKPAIGALIDQFRFRDAATQTAKGASRDLDMPVTTFRRSAR